MRPTAQGRSRSPAQRLGDRKQIASAVAFLASDEASYVHGAILPVDGGAIAA